MQALIQVIQLALEAHVFLLAKFELEIDDFLFLSEVGHYRTQLGQLRIHVAANIGIAVGALRSGIRNLTNPRSLGTDTVQMLVQKCILSSQILAPATKMNRLKNVRDASPSPCIEICDLFIQRLFLLLPA